MIELGQKAENEPVTYVFGSYLLDTRAGELRCKGERVSLAPKVFEVLLLLVQNPGKLISKREFLDKIWADTNVEEGSVTRAMTTLRAALDDSASDPQYVQTVPRRGYRFVASVERVAPDDLPRASSFQVVVLNRRYPLFEGENVVGRADDCDVSLKLAAISRRHAAITVDGGRAVVRDLRSKNGTFVNGRRVDAAVELRDGDEIRLGAVSLVFASLSGDPSTVTEISKT